MKKAPKTLAEMRAAAYAAFADHETDIKTNPEYNSKSGKRHPLSRPMTHQQACTMKSKFTQHDGRHIEIEQV
jgi:phenylalanyl-tRNA synthetase alpha subunit